MWNFNCFCQSCISEKLMKFIILFFNLLHHPFFSFKSGLGCCNFVVGFGWLFSWTFCRAEESPLRGAAERVRDNGRCSREARSQQDLQHTESHCDRHRDRWSGFCWRNWCLAGCKQGMSEFYPGTIHFHEFVIPILAGLGSACYDKIALTVSIWQI